MRVAFYAPLKPPDHPVPSGDRSTARLLFQALRLAGHRLFLASRLRSFDRVGNAVRQARLARTGEAIAMRLIQNWRRDPAAAPELWFTYHLYHKAPDHLGPAVSAALGIPYVVAEASYAPKQGGGPWDVGHRAVERALRRANAVVGLNPADRDCVLPLLTRPGRWRTMAPFLDAARFFPETGAPHGETRLITVGMMRHGDKLASYRALAEALLRIADLPWTLSVVGDGPARIDVVRALAVLGARVRYYGALPPENVPAALAVADLFVWPAINEAFCMAILEAQAAGLPVIAGASGGVGAIVASGSTGILVTPGDIAAFATATRRLLGDIAERRQMGVAARAKVVVEHDLPVAAARLRNIIAGIDPNGAA